MYRTNEEKEMYRTNEEIEQQMASQLYVHVLDLRARKKY